MKQAYSRRKFISASLFFGAGLVFAGCDSKKSTQAEKENATSVGSCDDFTGVSKAEIEKRKELGYVKESPIPDNQCDNCNLYIPQGTEKACGGCMLFDGPVQALGYCTYWAPQV